MHSSPATIAGHSLGNVASLIETCLCRAMPCPSRITLRPALFRRGARGPVAAPERPTGSSGHYRARSVSGALAITPDRACTTCGMVRNPDAARLVSRGDGYRAAASVLSTSSHLQGLINKAKSPAKPQDIAQGRCLGTRPDHKCPGHQHVHGEQWVIPPEASGAFVAAMEEVLNVYTGRTIRKCRSSAWTRPRSKLVAETRAPIPITQGYPEQIDSEYGRAILLMCSCCSRRLRAGGAPRS